MFQKVIKEYREGEYIIDVEYEWDYKNKNYITNFWISEENGGLKLHCIGEMGTLKESAIICTINSFLQEWIEYYEGTKEKLEAPE